MKENVKNIHSYCKDNKDNNGDAFLFLVLIGGEWSSSGRGCFITGRKSL
jgi:hypothetical protein